MEKLHNITHNVPAYIYYEQSLNITWLNLLGCKNKMISALRAITLLIFNMTLNYQQMWFTYHKKLVTIHYDSKCINIGLIIGGIIKKPKRKTKKKKVWVDLKPTLFGS